MSAMFSMNPAFCSQKSIVAPRKQPKTQGEILKEQTKKEAEKAKQKPKEEKTIGDYVTIGVDTINNIVDNAPVVYSTSPQKLNYMA